MTTLIKGLSFVLLGKTKSRFSERIWQPKILASFRLLLAVISED
jgi:hypothetical protein